MDKLLMLSIAGIAFIQAAVCLLGAALAKDVSSLFERVNKLEDKKD